MDHRAPIGWQAGKAVSAAGRSAAPSSERLSLKQFVLWLREAQARGGTEALAQLFRDHGQRLDREALEPYALRAAGRYTRTLVYRDEDMEVMVLGWSAGSRAPIHGHDGQECLLMTVAGALEMTDYRIVAGGDRPGYALIERVGPVRTLLPGAVDFRQEEAELHSVAPGAHSDFAISLHVYSRPIDSCLIYDPRRSSCETRQLQYDRVMHVTDSPLTPSATPSARPKRLRRLWNTLFKRAREVTAALVPARVTDGSAKISVKSMDHQYANKVVALREVNLNIRSGEFACLLGPSGCGKSTLLYALAGHIQPTGGQVRIDGKPIRGPGPDRLLMFQEAALFPWLTVRQNIEFVLAARGLTRAERSERAGRFIRYVHLDGFENSLPHELSGGMKMRAALARALAVDSPVLLMDEPFGSLDAHTRQHMHELLQRVWLETHKTIVFVTHDVTEALVLGNRVVVMAPRPGRILKDFEVRLPMPRGPDDVSLVSLARQIRTMLNESESMSQPGVPGERETRHAGVAPGSEADLPGGAADGVGAARPLRPVAASPLSGSGGGR